MPKPASQEIEYKVQEPECQAEQAHAKDVEKCEQEEAALFESEDRYKTLFENMVQGVFYQRADGVVVDCNPAALEMLGTSREQFIGKTSIDPHRKVIIEDETVIAGKQHPSMIALKSGKPVRNFLAAVFNPRKKDYVWLNINAIPQFKKGEDKPYQVIVTLHDITSQKRAEFALSESEKHFRALADLSPGGIYLTDKEGNCVYANEAWSKMAGMSISKAKGDGWDKAVYVEDRERIRKGWYNMVESDGRWQDEYRFQDQEGKITWVYGLAAPLYGDDGTITGYIGVNVDITDRKQTEDALKVSEQNNKDAHRFLQLVVDTIPVRLFWKDLKLSFLGCNRLFAWDAGFEEPAELIGADDYSMGWKSQADLYRKDDRDVITSGKPKLNYEEPQTTPEGKDIWLSTSKVPLRDSNEAIIGLLGTYEDITQRKKAEADLLRLQKIESLGRLAGGLAHKLNNILMSIMGNISLAKMKVSSTGDIAERLTNAEDGCLKAKDLSMQFLTFSKGGDPVKSSVSAPTLVENNCRLALSGSNVICKFNIPDDLWSFYADPGQIGQVLTNILINADQAMPDGGSIKVRCKNVIVGESDELPLKAGNYVKVSIQDQGSGIPGEYLGKIFDPYFSTKKTGNGLGLSSAYSIIHKHEGYLRVESTSESGTVFAFYVPASIAPTTVSADIDLTPLKENGHILVMDDDQMVLNAVKAMLNYLGYTVEQVECGEKALEKYHEAMHSKEPFDLVIMDLVIPGGMGGKETIKKLLTIDPHAKVIVSSGYSNDPVLAKYEKYGFSGVIAKPYRLNDLSILIKQIAGG